MEIDTARALELLVRVSNKDQPAFELLYRDVSRRVYAFALNHLRDEARAEDAVIEAMYEVWNHPERFDGSSKFSTWVLGIARYKILNVFRQDRHKYDELTEEMGESIANDDIPALEVIAAREREAGVRNCMDKLNDQQRECMHLVFFESMSLNEVAVLQQCPENTVKTRLFHARQKIKSCLQLLLVSEGHLEARGFANA
jgi:RNA polymerase sigma-70 factor, ECF subfamily